jgi:hypothetical protein
MEEGHIIKFLSNKNKKVFTQLKNFEIIKKVFKEDVQYVETKDLSIKGTILTLKLPTTKKQELFLKKGKIINKINTIAGEKIVTDIK